MFFVNSVRLALLLSIFLFAKIVQGKDVRFAVNYKTSQGIVRGVNVLKNEFPWLVRLNVNNRKQACNGAIIEQDWILTAAHCVKNDTNVTVIAGVLDLSETTMKGVQTRQSYKIIIHENYTFPGYDLSVNDVALIMVHPPFEMTKSVNRIDIASSEFNNSTGNAVIAGWVMPLEDGDENSVPLKKYYLKIFDSFSCRNILRYSAIITDEMICDNNQGKVACVGDFNGPLVCQQSNTYSYVCGITNILGGGYCNNLGVYTKVASYRAWIDKTSSPFSKHYDDDYREYSNSLNSLKPTNVVGVRSPSLIIFIVLIVLKYI